MDILRNVTMNWLAKHESLLSGSGVYLEVLLVEVVLATQTQSKNVVNPSSQIV
jgi:hypothetical protein